MTTVATNEAVIEAYLALRQVARKVRDFRLSDSIRNELLARGVEIEDGKNETIRWRLVERDKFDSNNGNQITQIHFLVAYQDFSKETKMKNFNAALEIRPMVLSRAFNLCKNSEMAEDLVQDAYLKAYKSFNTFVDGTNLGAWLNKIVFNEFLNIYRYNKKRKNITKPYPQNFDVPVLEVSSLPSAEEIPDSLSEGLKALNKEQRDVILLVMEGFWYKEIAAMFNIPIGTVMSRHSRARKIMKTYALKLDLSSK